MPRNEFVTVSSKYAPLSPRKCLVERTGVSGRDKSVDIQSFVPKNFLAQL